MFSFHRFQEILEFGQPSVTSRTEYRLKECGRQNGEAQSRMRVVPDAEGGRLLCEPDSHPGGDNIDEIGEDLANGVDLENDGVLQVES